MATRPDWATDDTPAPAPEAKAPDWAASSIMPKARDREASFVDPDPIDYKSGAPFWVRRQLSRASNREEAEKLLTDMYGERNFGTDERGRWWVRGDVQEPRAQPQPARTELGTAGVSDPLGTPEEPQEERKSKPRRVEVFGSGVGNFLETTAAQASAGGWPTAGAVGGGVIGTALGPVGAVLGAGGGAMVGKGIDEGIKAWEGFYKKRPTEAVATAVTEGATYAAFQAAGPLGKAVVVDPAKKFMRWWGGVTPETKLLGYKMVTEGAKPQLSVVAPKMKALHYDQMVRNLLSGDPKEPYNVAYLGQRVQRLLKDQGLNDREIMATLQEVNDKSAKLSSREADEAVSKAVQTRLGSLRASADSNMEFASGQLNGMETALRRWADAPPGDLASDVAGELMERRREFGRQMSNAYEDVHMMTGEEPVVPMSQIRRTAADFRTELQTANIPSSPMIDRLANDQRPYLTIKEAHELRTELRARAEDMFEANPLAPGPAWRRVNNLARSVDEAFNGLADSGEIGESAARALRETDRAYAAGMARFNDARVQKLVSMTRRGLSPDPEIITREIFEAGYANHAREIWGMLSPPVQARVQTTLMRDIINSSSERIGNDMMLDPSKLMSRLRDPLYRRSIEVPFTSVVLNQIDTLAQSLAAINGRVEVSNLAPGRIHDALRDAFIAHQEIDEFAKAHPLKALTSQMPYARDRGAEAVLAMGETALEDMQRFFAPEEMEAVRRYARNKVLTRAIEVQPTQALAVMGSGITDALKVYTKRQQEILFPGGFGEDLKELARDSKFLFPYEFGQNEKDFGGSLAAAHIKGMMPSPRVWIPYAWKHMTGAIADSEGLMKVLLDIKKADPTYGRILTRRVLRYLAISKMTGQEPGGEPTPRAPAHRAPPLPSGGL